MDTAGLRVLSRSSSSVASTQASSSLSSSTSTSSIPLSSSSIPYTPPVSTSFNFPAPPMAHNMPSYPPPACPPLPSSSLLNSSSARAFPSNSSEGKITILTSSASSTPSLLPSTSNPNPPPSDIPFTTPPGSGLFSVNTSIMDAPVDGVVVIGAIGRAEADVSQLLNRLLDAQVFASKGNWNWECSFLFDNILQSRAHSTMDEMGQGPILGGVEKKDVKKQDKSTSSKGLKRLHWMKKHLKLYHDEENGAVYVQFAWGASPTEDIRSVDVDVSTEDSEECMLRGLLYMFSVCHVILLVQEGARLDTHLLRNLRVLQSAKHLLAPFVKSQVLQGLHPTNPAAERTLSSARSSSLSAQSSGRSGTGGRNASTIALMSGSAPSFFPGQCTPVLLFVFLEDFNDATASSSHAISGGDDRAESSAQVAAASQQPGGPIISSRQTVNLKGSNAVVMLARSTNKTEGGLRKKLQSNLEGQIRYLVKKCKILGGFGDSFTSGGAGMGPRGPGGSMGSGSGALGGSSLFVLDTMRVACLLEKGPNLQCDALKAAMNAINDILSVKEDAAQTLTDSTSNAGEDIQAIRDFVWKQAEILRGRGGVLSNSTGGSMGVGMVAAAAAAAAASAAAGGFGGSGGAMKPLGNPPELPSMSNWLSACRILVDALVTGEGHPVKEAKKVQPVRVAGGSRRASSMESGNSIIHGNEALGITLGSLSSATDLDGKFSAEWCKRMFPSALAVYTKALPPCYPTLVHQSHLEKALLTFKGMVRGPAVAMFTNKLKEECEAVWKSGRQLCDAVSLTGRPCIHKIHDASQGSSDTLIKLPKSTETKNDDLLDLPGGPNDSKPHSSGLVFLHACACGRSRKLREDPFDFKSANTDFYQFSNCEDLLPSLVIPDCEGNKPMGGSAWNLVRLGGAKYYQQSTGLLQSGFSHNKKFLSPWIISYVLGASKQDTSAVFAEALHSNQQVPLPNVSRPLIGALSFLDVLEQGNLHSRSEIDAPARIHTKAVQDEKKTKAVEKIVTRSEKKQAFLTGTNMPRDEKRLFADVVARSTFEFPPLQQRQVHQKNIKQPEKKEALQVFGQVEPQHGFPALENVNQYKEHAFDENVRITPLKGASSVETKQELGKVGVKNTVAYLGFEHECPRGHRFLLSSEQVEALGSIGLTGESVLASQNKPNDTDDNPKEAKHHQDFFTSSRSTAASQEIASKPSADTAWNLNVPDNTSCKIVNDGSGEGYSLLNTNLPVYMPCPYCSKLSEKKKKNSPAFAGNISQLQRIFLVTPALPLLIATCPSVQFDDACVGQGEHTGGIKFSLGCSVVLPPESFVVLRLPFVYYLQLADGAKHPLNCKVHQPESTAWLLKSSTFKIISKDEGGSV